MSTKRSRSICHHLGFVEEMHPTPPFAMLSWGDLRLLLSAGGQPGGPGGGSQVMPDGRVPEPGGWNRFTLEVIDLAATVATLRTEGGQFRNDIVTGVGGKQILLEDPSGIPSSSSSRPFPKPSSRLRLDLMHLGAP